jgi:hypothetical protein
MRNADLTLNNSTRCPHCLLQTVTGVDTYTTFGLVPDSENQAHKVLDSLYDKWAWIENIRITEYKGRFYMNTS